jgi:flagellar motor switch protein FliN/FliY
MSDDIEELTLGDALAETTEISLESLYDVAVEISVVLGRTKMPVSQLLKLGRGAVVQLDQTVGESLDIFINDRLVARGEIVIVENKIGITMTEIIKTINK